MMSFDYIQKVKIKKHNPNWSKISTHPSVILITGAL